MRGTQNLLPDARNVVVRIKEPDRRIDVIQVDDQVPQSRACMRDLAGDLRSLLDEPARVFGRSVVTRRSAASIRATCPISDAGVLPR